MNGALGVEEFEFEFGDWEFVLDDWEFEELEELSLAGLVFSLALALSLAEFGFAWLELSFNNSRTSSAVFRISFSAF